MKMLGLEITMLVKRILQNSLVPIEEYTQLKNTSIYLLHWNVQNRSLQLTCQSSRLSWIWSESAKPGQLWWRLPVSSLSIVVGPLNKNIVVGELNHCACYVTGNHSMYIHWAKIVETLFSKPC